MVAINKFYTDTDAELNLISEACKEYGANVALFVIRENGGEGGKELAKEVVRIIEEEPNHFEFSYADELSLKEKIESIVTQIYGGKGVIYESAADKELTKLEKLGFGHMPICMAMYAVFFCLTMHLSWVRRRFYGNGKEGKGFCWCRFCGRSNWRYHDMPGLPKVPGSGKY